MTPERLEQIQELYHAALERDASGRAVLLAQVDSELRREVESLLAQNGGVMEKPAMEVAADLLASGELKPGTELGPYRVEGLLGAGGMGRVYNARDTRLGRAVAIKVASSRFSERFQREARTISALNHPHICTLYDVGPNYLVMELVEGPTLADRIKKGPVPLEEALAIARQIAEGLAVAHDEGIVHRDLKPANIKIKPDGTVKILDFGLAKTARAKACATGESTVTLTETGTIMGTAAYMSPEQARGEEVDKRADIWAFGVVLYEMLTGRRPFQGDSSVAVLAAVIKEEPDWHRVPAQACRLLGKCMEKDPKQRLRDVGDAFGLLEARVMPLPARAAKPAARWPWAAALAGAIILAAVGWWVWPKRASPARAMRFEISLPDKVGFTGYVSVSPDGLKLAIPGAGEQSGLWIRNLDSVEWRRLRDTEGATIPFWSPDSRFLGFGTGNQLKKIDINGGPPQTLCEMPGPVADGAWSQDGTIIFGVGRGRSNLWRVSQAGGLATAVTSVDTAHERYHALPDFLPDGRHFLYLRGPGEGIYVGSLYAKPAEQSQQRLLAAAVDARYADGYVFFMRGNALIAQPFDASKFQLRGEPVPIAERVSTTVRIAPGATSITTTAVGAFSASPSGVLAYRAGAAGPNFQRTWVDRQGKSQGTAGQPGPYQGLALSPDGKRVAGRSAVFQEPGDIWTLDLTREVGTRFTFRQSQGSYPVWSGDGSRIAFSAGRVSPDTLFSKASSGAGEEKELYTNPGEWIVPTSWSRDGRFLLYTAVNTPNTSNDVWVLPLEGDRKPVLLLGTQFVEDLGAFSPDGRWIAYVSNESGRDEVYGRPFVAQKRSGTPALGDGKWQISRNGGTQPHWRADGKEIFFVENGTMFAAEVKTSGSALEVGVPQELFTKVNFGWDVTPDGQRFLMAVPPAQQNSPVPITVVLNWQADLKR